MDRLANQKLPFSKKKLPKRVIISYIVDYLIIVFLVGAFYAVDKIEPFHQQFSLANYTLHYTFAVKERIPVPFLLVLVGVVPAIVIGIYTLVIDGLFSHQTVTTMSSGRRRTLTGKYRLKDRLWELNCGLLGLLLAIGTSFVMTGALKNAIGKPRPDLIDRCKPTVLTDPPNLQLSNFTICNQPDKHILNDGFKSFPSGHSSSAFSGLFYLSLYLAAKLHVLDSKGEVWKTFVVMMPTLGAALIAGSRIMDARHHPFDVLSGSALGILTAWAAYRQYFPPVSETWRKGRAYPIRSWGKEPVAPTTTTTTADDAAPLQGTLKPNDEERPSSASSSGVDTRGNVFREQIASSQRMRNPDDHSPSNAPPPGFAPPRREQTSSSTYSQQLHTARNPFLPPPGRHENYDESSSEDDSGYEMQRQYTLSNPQRSAAISPYDPSYHAQETAYPQQSVPAARSVMPPSTQERAPAGPEKPRGVQLTETYA